MSHSSVSSSTPSRHHSLFNSQIPFNPPLTAFSTISLKSASYAASETETLVELHNTDYNTDNDNDDDKQE